MTTRASEGAAYRAEQRDIKGTDAFKRHQRDLKRASRARLKAARSQPVAQPDESYVRLVDAVFLAKQKQAKTKGKTIKRETVEQQFDKVKNLYLATQDDMEFNNLSFLKDSKTITGYIDTKYTNQNSRGAYYQAIASILSVIGSYKKYYKLYSDLSVSIRKDIENLTDKNALSAKERANHVNFSELKKS
jgi:hypothetical protein